MEVEKVSAGDFYHEWHGHKVSHLKKLLPNLRSTSESLIWTAGDSSLDNKYWFKDQKPAVGEYSKILDPPRSICDVTYWLNALAIEQRNKENKPNIAAINTAVEATTLNERWYMPRPQDKFIRDNIGYEDTLIVSIGGNDIALCPTLCTVASMAGLLCLPSCVVEKTCTCGTVPVNDCCCGCGASLASCACACPPLLTGPDHEINAHLHISIPLLYQDSKIYRDAYIQNETKKDPGMYDILPR
eukprot:scaffold23438_cov50-Attheya_sp.AAC.1